MKKSEELNKKGIEDIFALTPLQEGMLFHYLKAPGSGHYFEQLTLAISGEINQEFFEKAWNLVIETNEMLRAVYRWKKLENPVQIILKSYKLEPAFHDLTGKKVPQEEPGAGDRLLEEIRTQDRKKTFDLREVPFRVTLCKVQEDSYEMIISSHHILYDGWSNGIILKEFFNAYHALFNGREWLKPLKSKFKEFVKWVKNRDINKEEKFWGNYLQAYDEHKELSIKRRRDVKGAVSSRNYRFRFPGDIKRKFDDFARRHKVTLASLLYSAWGALLQRYDNSDDVLFGTTVSGRSGELQGIEEIVGLFINTVPLRVQTLPGEKIGDFLGRINHAVQSREAYEHTPLVAIKEYSGWDNERELFDSLVVIENYPLDRVMHEDHRLSVSSYSMVENTHYDLTLGIEILDGLECVFSYNGELFDEEAVRGLGRHFKVLLGEIVNNPGIMISQLEIMPEDEKQKVLYEFNDTGTGFPSSKTLHGLFEEQAARTPCRTAVAGPVDMHLSYGELERGASRVAFVLREKGVGPDSIVGLKVERSIEMLTAVFGILKAGGAYLPIDPGYPEDRINYMMADSRANLCLDSEFYRSYRSYRSYSRSTQPATSLAYIIYTSGSTGRPKGVIVEHRSVVNILFALHKEFPLKAADTYLLKTSYIFDVSVTELFGWFLEGGRLAVLEKGDEKNPGKILEAIERRMITHINFVPSMFNVLVGALTPRNVSKLSGLKWLFLAGEALSPGLVKKFMQWDSGTAIENIYGPTEATIYASRYPLSLWKGSDRVPIGAPLPNTMIHILGKTGGVQPVGVPGELCISGVCLARGYLNNPELTAEKFNRPMTADRLYRTGDLARWLPDGNIDFLGRIDHQVKIRGYRVELGEIENRLKRHPDIKEAVVSARIDMDGTYYLCAYFLPHSFGTGDIPGLREFMLQYLPGYMVPSYFVPLEVMPVTAGGKIDRGALPEPQINRRQLYAPPRNRVEKKLTAIWSEVLGIEKEKIGIDDGFFELGGHSLKIAGLIGRINKVFNIEVSFSTLFAAPTIRGISHHIKKVEMHTHHGIRPVEEKEYYPLSLSQKRFYVFQQLHPADISYNITEIIRIEGQLSIKKFESTFRELLHRHESLRTSFHMVEGEPVQRIHDIVEFHISYYDCREAKEEEVEKITGDFIRPFDLTCAPLWRVGLIDTEPGQHLLIFDMHHLIADGTSTGIFIKEFLSFYNRELLPPVKIRYRDYVAWRNQEKEVRGAEGKIPGPGEWEDQLLNLPTDFQRPAVPCYEGSAIESDIGEMQTKALYNLCIREDVTIYMLLLAVYNVLLAKLSGQENIAVGSPITDRRHIDLEHTVGLMLNIICLRNRPSAEKSFAGFLQEIKDRAIYAYEKQDYQYDELLEHTQIARDTGRNPLFDVMLVLQNMEIPNLEISGLKIIRGVGGSLTSKFDITLYCEERDTLVFKWEYNTSLFEQATVRRFMRYFENILEQILAAPNRTIGEIEIITGEEKRRILYGFNETGVPYPLHKTIYRLFEEQAEKTPGNTALIGIDAGDHESEQKKKSLTYKELNEKSNRLARLLRTKGAGRGTIIGLMVERTVEMVTAVLAILKAGGTYLPIDPAYPEDRINWMLESSKTLMVLTGIGKRLRHGQLLLLPMDRLEQNSRFHAQSPGNPEPLSGPEDLIYIIFTSGSTGKPKGAGVYHRGFMNLMHWFVTEFRLDANDRNLLLTSPSFDLTQKNLYASLINGGFLCLPGIDYFEPRFLLRQIHELEITWINCTPSMFYKMVEYEEAGEEKRLSRLRYVFLGGEPISMASLIHWLESEHCRAEIVNTYGPTECTDICASYRIREPRRFLDSAVPVGKPVYNVQLYVLDRNLQLLPVGVAGELLIGGDGVGIGYINDKDLTEQKFINRTFEFEEPGHLLYRTGDLVKWLADGNIEFLGRIDHQVKVRGFRIELGEIENQLLNYPAVKETLVMAKNGDIGEKYLCAYIVLHTGQSLEDEKLRAYLLDRLPDYMVPAYFVVLDRMPLNPNGKVDRKALPEPDMNAGASFVPPRSETENILAGIWADILALDKNKVGIHDNFFLSGGHSLKAATLVGRIHRAFSVEIPIAQLFQEPTIQGISNYIDKADEIRYRFIEPVEKKEYYPLSSAQKRLYIIYQLDPTSIAYNIPGIMELEGALDRNRFEEALGKLVDRHESLRTSFHLMDGEPVQKVHNSSDISFEIDYSAGRDSFVRVFNLSHAPLLRVGLSKIEEKKHLLLFDMHHVISDGVSMGIFIKEFSSLYRGEELSTIHLHYKDFSRWQNDLIASGAVKKQEEYWLRQYEGDIPLLELPLDYPRTADRQTDGNRLRFELGKDKTTRLSLLVRDNNTTLFTMLLSVFGLLLSKLSSREDIIVGCPTSGRSRHVLEGIIGMFVNTMPVRIDTAGEHSLPVFIKNVKENVLMAFENQDYPYENLVDRAAVNRDLNRNPLFDAAFVLQNVDMQQLDLPGLTLIPIEYETGTSKFDLTLVCVETTGDLQFTFEYCTGLFKESAIRRFTYYFKKIITGILENPGILLGEIELLSPEEKKQVLIDFNDTGREYPRDKTIHRLFEEQVERAPDRIAVTGLDPANKVSLTYRELNERAGRLAAELNRRSVTSGGITAIMIDSRPVMITGILAILKTGGAYLPIDPGYPAERVKYMLRDSGCKMLLTGEKQRETVGSVCPAVDLDGPRLYAGKRDVPVKTAAAAGDLAYVIYTSGSSGRPKGVPVEHGSLVNLCYWHNESFSVTPSDRAAKYAAFGFDASVWEIFPYLIVGAALFPVPGEIKLDIPKLNGYFEAADITVAFLPTNVCEQFMKIANDSLRILLTGGDKLKEYIPGNYKLINNYGPTESTVVATSCPVPDAGDGNIPIGKPAANTSIYILNKRHRLQPVGVQGELCISGRGLSRGYLNRPELTMERFVENPHKLNERMYLTGDRAHWLPDGNIRFLGRIDQQVKIRGVRIETGEIENYLLGHRDITGAVVIAVTDENNDKHLCAYIVSARELTVRELRDYLSEGLPLHMVPSYFMPIERIPLTANGKVDRKALPPPGKAGTGARRFTAPRDKKEDTLAAIWSEVLGIEKEHIGIDDNFFQLGGHSLKISRLTGRVHKELLVDIPIVAFFKTPTIRGISRYIESTGTTLYDSIEPVEKKEYYALSSPQNRLYILQQMALEGTGYNIPVFFELEGKPDKEKLEETFRALINRHESLRTSFQMINSQTVQRIYGNAAFEIEWYEPDSINCAGTMEGFVRPFDLSRPPLLRVGLLHLPYPHSPGDGSPGGKYILMIDMHHIISDGFSHTILARDFGALYGREPLPRLRINYKDYSEWQAGFFEFRELKKQEDYWLEQFEGEIPVVELPADYERPPVRNFKGGGVSFEIGREETGALKKLAVDQNATLFMVLMSLYTILLSKLCGQEDIVVGTPTAGRNHHDLENIIGVFINTLVLRNHPRGEKAFDEFLREIKDTCLNAFSNQDYPFEELVEKIAVNRDAGRNPLFDVMLVLQNIENRPPDIPGLQLRPYDYERRTSKFDMTLTAVEEKEGLYFSITYSTSLFKESTVQRFIKYFQKILSAVLEDSGRRLSGIDILADEEKKQILYDFNAAAEEYSREKTIHRLFEEQVEKTPHHIALAGTGLESAFPLHMEYLSYKELDKTSGHLARLLTARGVKPGTITGVMIGPSLEMIIAVLAILKAGSAYMPIDPDYPQDRVRFMLKDSSAKLLIVGRPLEFLPDHADTMTIDHIDRQFPSEAVEQPEKVPKPHHSESLAYVIYTSGSSGRPKGVMVRHRNVMNLLTGLKRKIYHHYNRYLRVALAAPISFDASVKQIAASLLQGHGLYLIPSPVRFDGGALWSFFNRCKIDLSDGTPAHIYILCETPQEKHSQTSVCYPRHFAIGGDALSPGLVERFFNCFDGKTRPKITNIYGPTECTVDSTAFDVPADNLAGLTHMPIGKPLTNHFLYILGNDYRLLPVGVPGELYIGGESVARGYLNQPELTAEKFIDLNRSYKSYRSYRSCSKEDKLYRTGDRARWLSDGNIEFLGRIDRQVKIRGHRIEPAEIESRLLSYAGVKEAAVITKQDKRDQSYLCAYITVEGEFSPLELRNRLAALLPGYMVPSYFVQLEKLPLTTSGKLDRKLLPEPELEVMESGYTAPAGRVEKELAQLWLEVLGAARIGIDDNFFHMGGHSLTAIILLSKIHKALNVRVALAEIFKAPTIRELSICIQGKEEVPYASIEPVEEKEYHVLSSAQERMYILNQMDETGTGYNIPYVSALEGDVDCIKIKDIFLTLITRHKSLRTSFRVLDGKPVQKISDAKDFEIEYREVGGNTGDIADLIRDFIRPFDLSRSPLLRVGLTRIENGNGNKHLLMVDLHHIISDGISIGILVKEFMALASGEELPQLRLQYTDFSEWQSRETQKEALNKQKVYWKKQFEGELPVLELPTDYARPTTPQFKGSTVTFEIDREEADALRSSALEQELTLYMKLLAIYTIFLSKLCRREDIIIGTPTAGRRHADLEQVMGMFVNTLVLRNYPAGEKTYDMYLREVKERTLEAFENQDCPFEKLLEALSVSRDVGRNPLFDTMFSMQNVGIPQLEIKDLKLTPYEFEIEISKFDLSLNAVEVEKKLVLTFEYSTGLFKKVTIERFITYFKKIVSCVIAHPGGTLSGIEILSEEETREILEYFNNTFADYPKDKVLHQLFEEQAAKSPDRVAVVGGREREQQISYKESDRRGGQMAAVLREKSVGPGSIVGIMLERSPEMMVAIIGILKTGGAYLPLDPDYPEDRINYMMADSGAALCLDNEFYKSYRSYGTYSRSPQPSASLIYIIYTSGTTGRPKGVMVEHRNVVAYVYAFYHEFGITSKDTFLQQASSSFDVFVEEVYPILLKGGKLVVVPKETVIEMDAFRQVLLKQDITIVSCSPLLLNAIDKSAGTGSVRIFISGGDVLKREYIGNLLKRGAVYNTYGPTETTVCATYYRCAADDRGDPPIGKSIAGYSVYILDDYSRLLPIGVAGELCIAGAGVSRGYLNRPELTAEKFDRDKKVNDRFYRTGDLARWLPDGNIEFLGRIDLQVKIRGYRIELGEIESRLLEYDEIEEAIVLAGENGRGEKYLAAYFVSDSNREPSIPVSIPALRNYLEGVLPGYMIPSYFIQMAEIPLTPNGKPDRGVLPAPEPKAGVEYIAPRDRIEEKLARLWSEVLEVEEDVIGIEDNFFELGGHSLKATMLSAEIHKEFNVKLPLVEIFKTPRIRELSACIKSLAEERYESIEPVEKKEYYGLSSAQERLYVLHQIEMEGTAYNMPQFTLMEIANEATILRLEDTFIKLIERHESLRSSFHIVNDRPVQRVHQEVSFAIEHYENRETPRNFIRHFELSRAPLLRVGLQKTGEKQYLLLVDMHHIISDGISHEVLINDFTALYEGTPLPPLRIQYKDFTGWWNRNKQKESIQKQGEYWLMEFGDELPVLNLPLDFVRPAVQSFEGGRIEFELDREESDALKRLAREEAVTLFMMLSAVYNVLLSKLAGQEDIVVGTPIAGRRHPDLHKLIGMFVNTLALRNYPRPGMPFTGFLKQLKNRTLDAFENQDYPFEELVDQVTVTHDAGRNPVFDTMFALQNTGNPELEIPALKPAYYKYERAVAKFDLNLNGFETGDIVSFALAYGKRLFKEETILRFIEYFKKVITGILDNPHQEISQIEIIGDEEKHRILYAFNDTSVPYPKEKSICRFLLDQVERTPGSAAVVGPLAGKGFIGSITYKELDRQISNTANVLLRSRGIRPGDIVGIMGERSIELLIGILAILKAGCAYLPIDPGYPPDRIDYMLADSNAAALVTTPGIEAEVDIKAKVTHTVMPAPSDPSGQRTPGAAFDPPTGHSLAYVIYTSGSTGKPKGVLVKHHSVVNLVLSQQNRFNIDEHDRVLQFSTVCFDASVEQIFLALFSGARLVLVNENTLLDIDTFEALIARQSITHLHAVPSFLSTMTMGMKQSYHLKRVLSGGDTCPPRLAEKWSRHHSCDFYNRYGPTETTVTSIEFDFKEEKNGPAGRVPIGKPINNTFVYLLDKRRAPVPLGVAGELYIGGEGVARGYLNRPELTNDRFINAPTANDRRYRTGDLARWLPDGNIEFLGRIDFQVKVRGFRVELGEIENHLSNHPEIRGALVLAGKEKTGDQFLYAYIVSDRTFAPLELRDYLAETLPDYMLPAYFVQLEAIPLTTSGKPDRKALPAPVPAVSEGHTGPRNPVEEKLVRLWAEVLDVEKDAIGIDSNFFDLGGHSLKATVLSVKIRKELNVKLSLAEIFKTPRIRELSAHIKNHAKDRYTSIEQVEKREYYPLSSAQKRLYFLHQMEPGSTAYNLPVINRVEVAEEHGIVQLEETFKKLIERHESFRTSFHMVNHQLVQRVHREVPFQIEWYENESASGAPRSIPLTSTIKTFIRPFDLSRVPLFRVGLQKAGKKQYLLFVDMHHIISDGVSHGIFIKDFTALYDGAPLPPLRIQYKDFSRWQTSDKEKENLEHQGLYWLKEFEDQVPVLNLPIDYPRPEGQGFKGSRIDFELDKKETELVKACAAREGITLYMLLLTLHNILLSKLCNQEDIIIGTPIAGRRHADLEKIIGMFVNTLALRNFPNGQKNLRQFLSEVKVRTLEAFENQEYPFEDLVDKVAIGRSMSRNPLFDVMFIFQNTEVAAKEISEIEVEGLKVKPHTHKNIMGISKFDLTLSAIEINQKLQFAFEYCTEVFREETIERFIRYFKKIISAVLESTDQEISRVEIMSEGEKKRVLYEFNQTGTEYPKDNTIHAIFAEQVEKHPDGVAVVFETQALSYGALDRLADRFASYLVDKGVVPGMPVGIMLNPSVEMIVGVVAILKAGGAYLPINPGYPARRKQYMLDDGSANILIAETPAPDMLNRELEIIDIDVAKGGMFTGPLSSSSSCNIPHEAHPAYVIYTSGSTGNPRGVMVEHQNVVRLVKNTDYIRFKSGDRILQTGALEFDASTFEIWGALLNGLTLYLASKDKLLNPGILKEILVSNQITTIWMTSPLFNQMVQADVEIFSAIENLLVGGDVLSPFHINRVKWLFPRLNIINGYGPTENTTFSTTFLIDKEYKENIPIGKPIANSTAYIVNKYKKLQPVGVAGELYVGGDGISRGYMNNPELTAERFIEPIRPIGSVKLYKTGDLARWLPDGNIEFLGRMDHQMKIRGFRIEPGEIESRLLEYGGIKDVVVLSGDDAARDKYLVAYIVPGSGGESSGAVSPVSVPALRDYLSTVLPGYMVPSYFVQLEKITLTANGKIDRRILPKPAETAEETSTAPRNEIERKLADIWADVLLLKTPVGIDDNFFYRGGHSLKAIALVSKIYSIFNVKVPLTEMFKIPTIRGLSQYIKDKVKVRYTSIEAAEKREYHHLSSAQKRLYFLQQMDPAGTAYNIPLFISLSEEASSEQLEETFKKLIIRHEGFRTSFHIVGNEPVQRIHDRVEFAAEYYNQLPGGDSRPVTDLIKEFVRPFDLSLAPLLHVRFIKRETAQYLLFIDIHHIIFDGVSHNILVNDFMAFWKGNGLRPLQVQYKDFARWQNCLKENETMKKQRRYWLEMFSGKIPSLSLPGDFPRPAGHNFEGDVLELTLNREETGQLKALASRENVTLYMLLFAAFGVLLAKLSGNTDIVIGCSTTGRMHPEFQQIIGMFVNTLAIRCYPGEQESFREYLQETKENILAAFDNQDYQFEDLVDDLAIPREVGRNPLFDVLFALQNFGEEEKEHSIETISHLELDAYEYDDRRAKFDLMIVGIEKKEGLIFKFSYRTKLFKKNTIERFTGYFGKIVSVISRDPGTKIADIDIVGEQERGRLINELREENVEFLENRDTDREHAKTMEADFDY